MKLQTKIRDNHTMSLENKPTTYSSMMYLKFSRLKYSLFEVSQKIFQSSDFAKISQADYECCLHLPQKLEPSDFIKKNVSLNKWISLALIYSSSRDSFDQWETSMQGSTTRSQLVAEE